MQPPADLDRPGLKAAAPTPPAMPVRLARAATVLGALYLLGCAGGSGGTGPDHMLRLGIAEGSAIGLRYGEHTALHISLLTGDGHPQSGATITFSLSSDAMGATLSGDRATTNDAGIASVSLTAGAAEAGFRLTASTDGATDLAVEVAVSRFPFVALDALVSYTGGLGHMAQVSALLYDDRPCARIVPTPGVPGMPAGQSSPASTATFHFVNLRAIDYALVGRAVDKQGHLTGFGCVDVASAQLSTAGLATVPVPMAPALPTIAGTYALSHVLQVAEAPSPVAGWDALIACGAAPAQNMLDALVAALGPGATAQAVEMHRAPPDKNGCRPLMINGTDSLDATVAQLIEKSPAAASLPALVADLDAIVATATITSQLSCAKSGAGWLGSHTLGQVKLSAAKAGHTVTYEPGALGVPVPVADNVAVTVEGGQASIARHGFTLRLPPLWGRAFAELSLAPKKLPADPRQLLALIVASAMRGQLTGCSAIGDHIAQVTGVAGGSIATSCERGLDTLAATLAVAFAPTEGLDYTLAGTATPTDLDGNLVVDTLANGVFAVEVAVAPARTLETTVSFTAVRIP